MHLQGLQTDCLYNYLDQLEKESLNLDGSSPTITYQYDDNGSLTSKSITGGDSFIYIYNLQNMLRQLKVNGLETVNYYYNPDGIRVGKENIGGISIDYLIDPYNHTGYSQVFKENPSSGSSIAYIIGNDVLGQATGTSNPVYMLYDGHGSVRQLADNSGNTVTGQNFNFDAYGNLINAATPQTNLLYTGEYYDSGQLRVSPSSLVQIKTKYSSFEFASFNDRQFAVWGTTVGIATLGLSEQGGRATLPINFARVPYPFTVNCTTWTVIAASLAFTIQFLPF